MTERTNEQWLSDMQSNGPAHGVALQDLRSFILRGVMGYLYSRSDLAKLDSRALQQLGEDSVQEALLKIEDKLDTFKGKSKFTTWATKIAINHLISELRRHHWQNISLHEVISGGATLEDIIAMEPGSAGNPSLAAERQMVWNAILKTLENDLTDRQREALVATQLNGVPLSEAARMMDTNINNLYKLLHDARLKLKKGLTAQGLQPGYILDLFSQ